MCFSEETGTGEQRQQAGFWGRKIVFFCFSFFFQKKLEELKDECFVKVSDCNRSLEQKMLLHFSYGTNESLQDTYLCMEQSYCIRLMLCEETKGK